MGQELSDGELENRQDFSHRGADGKGLLDEVLRTIATDRPPFRGEAASSKPRKTQAPRSSGPVLDISIRSQHLA